MIADQELARRIEAGARELGILLPRAAPARLLTVLRLLEKWSNAYNLTAIRDVEQMVPLHVLDSLSALHALSGRDIIDVGTGAGFPGVPLAIAAPERKFTLVDSSSKKLRFVEHAALELGLDNVRVVHSRAEDYAQHDAFDTVICRAFASLDKVIALCARLPRASGRIVAMKGRAAESELRAIPTQWEARTEPLTVPGLRQERHLVVLTRRSGRGSSSE